MSLSICCKCSFFLWIAHHHHLLHLFKYTVTWIRLTVVGATACFNHHPPSSPLPPPGPCGASTNRMSTVYLWRTATRSCWICCSARRPGSPGRGTCTPSLTMRASASVWSLTPTASGVRSPPPRRALMNIEHVVTMGRGLFWLELPGISAFCQDEAIHASSPRDHPLLFRLRRPPRARGAPVAVHSFLLWERQSAASARGGGQAEDEDALVLCAVGRGTEKKTFIFPTVEYWNLQIAILF